MSKFPPSHKNACGVVPTARMTEQVFYNAPSKLARISFPWNGARAGPIAAVERGPSEGARSGSRGVARVSFHTPTPSPSP